MVYLEGCPVPVECFFLLFDGDGSVEKWERLGEIFLVMAWTLAASQWHSTMIGNVRSVFLLP